MRKRVLPSLIVAGLSVISTMSVEPGMRRVKQAWPGHEALIISVGRSAEVNCANEFQTRRRILPLGPSRFERDYFLPIATVGAWSALLTLTLGLAITFLRVVARDATVQGRTLPRFVTEWTLEGFVAGTSCQVLFYWLAGWMPISVARVVGLGLLQCCIASSFGCSIQNVHFEGARSLGLLAGLFSGVLFCFIGLIPDDSFARMTAAALLGGAVAWNFLRESDLQPEQRRGHSRLRCRVNWAVNAVDAGKLRRHVDQVAVQRRLRLVIRARQWVKALALECFTVTRESGATPHKSRTYGALVSFSLPEIKSNNVPDVISRPETR